MGKAKIISGGDKGLYNIELIEHTTRITADLAKINARLPILETAITNALTTKTAAETDYNAKKAVWDTAIGQYSLGLIKKSNVEKAQSDYTTALKTLQEKSFSYSLLLQEKESKTKQKALLEAIPPAHTVDGVWCADLTEDLAAGAEVGTIEPNGEPDGDIIIYPSGEQNPFKDQLQPVMASTPAGYFLNMARFPGWQRWKPTFRIGTITSIDNDEDTCNLTLDEAVSSVQGLNINPSSLSLSSVPIEYLTCNARAFTVDDRVVVEFTGQNWSNPKVIGFESNPKACDEFAVFILNAGSGNDVAVIWNIGLNELVLGPVAVTDAAFVGWRADHNVCNSAASIFSGFAWDVTSPYKIRPDLTDQEPATVDGVYSYIHYHDHDLNTLTGLYFRFPESVYASVLSHPELDNYAGLRTAQSYESVTVTQNYYYFVNPDYTRTYYWYTAPDEPTPGENYNGLNPGEWGVAGEQKQESEWTDDFSFYGPLGLMGTFGGTGSYSWHAATYTGEYFTYTYENRFIPNWEASTGSSYTEEEAYVKGKPWYGSSCRGMFTDSSFAVCCMIQYGTCLYTKDLLYPGSTVFEEHWTIESRTVLIQAKVGSLPGNGDWWSAGKDTALSAKLSEAATLLYQLHGELGEYDLLDFVIDVLIYK